MVNFGVIARRIKKLLFPPSLTLQTGSGMVWLLWGGVAGRIAGIPMTEWWVLLIPLDGK